jgi:5-formyltetrahydrofolate cyclo-ligase
MLYEPIEPRLRFAPLTRSTSWKRNRFGITEPDMKWKDTLHARQLDVVLMPLVAFDRNGHRLGMGGGYYDRTLSFRRSRKHWLKPLLIGVAHSIQEHSGLPTNPWDIPVDAIITESDILSFTPEAAT